MAKYLQDQNHASNDAATVASDEEVLFFIERHALMGRGIGYMDADLLAATALAGQAQLWTRDQRLRAVAGSLNLRYPGT